MKTSKDINFLPDYLVSKQIKSRKKIMQLMIAALIILVLCGVVLIPQMIYSRYENQIFLLDSELDKYSEVKNKIRNYSTLVENGNKKSTILSEIEKNQMIMTELINDIENATPYNIEIGNYSISGNKLTVSFTIHSPLDIVNIMENFEKLKWVKSVTIVSMPIVDKTEKISINFELK